MTEVLGWKCWTSVCGPNVKMNISVYAFESDIGGKLLSWPLRYNQVSSFLAIMCFAMTYTCYEANGPESGHLYVVIDN